MPYIELEVQGFLHRIQDFGFRIEGLGLRVLGLGMYELLSILALSRDPEQWTKGSLFWFSIVPNIVHNKQPMSIELWDLHCGPLIYGNCPIALQPP